MNSIQTMGQQRYYDFIADKAKRNRTNMIVWMSLLAVALICVFNNIIIAVILAAAGIFLAATNMKSQQDLKEKLNVITDKEEFYRQLGAPDLITAEEGRILVAKDYVLVYHSAITLYQLADMDKMEVGIQGKIKKTLYLTDKKGVRHEIFSCPNTPEDSKEFDKIYYALKDRGL